MFWEIYVGLCRDRGLSANAVARELSIASGTVSEWKKGRMPQNATLKRIAEYFGVSVGHLTGKGIVETAEPAHRSVRVRVYDGLSAEELLELASVGGGCDEGTDGDVQSAQLSSGIPLSMIDDCSEYEEISAETAGKGAYVALRLQDDAMEPRMMAGDVVIVRVGQAAEDGDTVVAFVEGRAVCRRMKRTGEGMLLLATNQRYEPVFCSQAQTESGEVSILGRVVELRAKY